MSSPRQIRNAFQTAIALAEYEARLPGAETPTLGKEQFDIIATASELFDRYLKDTYGGDTEADLARKEQTRSDYFGTPLVKTGHTSRAVRRSGKRNGKDPESESEVVSEESEEEDEEEEEETEDEDEDDVVPTKKQDKAAPPTSSKNGAKESVEEDDDDVEEAFKKFLKLQKMSKKLKK